MPYDTEKAREIYWDMIDRHPSFAKIPPMFFEAVNEIIRSRETIIHAACEKKYKDDYEYKEAVMKIKCRREVEQIRLDLSYAKEAARIWMLRAEELGYKK